MSVQWDVDELEKKRGEIEGTDKLKMRMVLCKIQLKFLLMQKR